MFKGLSAHFNVNDGLLVCSGPIYQAFSSRTILLRNHDLENLEM